MHVQQHVLGRVGARTRVGPGRHGRHPVGLVVSRADGPRHVRGRVGTRVLDRTGARVGVEVAAVHAGHRPRTDPRWTRTWGRRRRRTAPVVMMLGMGLESASPVMVVAYAASWPGSSRLARNRRAQRRDRGHARLRQQRVVVAEEVAERVEHVRNRASLDSIRLRVRRRQRKRGIDGDGANAPPFEVRRAAAEAAQDGLHGRAGPAAAERGVRLSEANPQCRRYIITAKNPITGFFGRRPPCGGAL